MVVGIKRDNTSKTDAACNSFNMDMMERFVSSSLWTVSFRVKYVGACHLNGQKDVAGFLRVFAFSKFVDLPKSWILAAES